jgi:transposase
MPKVTEQPLELPLDVGSEPVPTGNGTNGKQMLDIRALKEMSIAELTTAAKDLGASRSSSSRSSRRRPSPPG